MKLYFSFPDGQGKPDRRGLSRAAKNAVPGARLQWREDTLCVTLPGGDFRMAKNLLLETWQELGVQAKELPPPVEVPEMKAGRTVRLPVFVVSLIAAVLAASLLTLTFSGAFRKSPTLGTDAATEDYQGKIALIDEIFTNYSLYDTDGNLLLDRMLKAYATATGDRYAAYYTAEEFEAMMQDNNAQSVGVGILVTEDAAAGGVRIINVFPGSPAAAAGVQIGDLIVCAGEGEAKITYAENGYELLMQSLKGEEGSTAVFSVLRDGKELTFSVVRARVQTVSVMGRVMTGREKIGVVRILQFDLSTPTQFTAEMEALLAKGCTQFVFDLRNNPGGDLRSVSAILSYFLNKNDLIVSTVTKNGTESKSYVKAVTYNGDSAGCSVSESDIGKYRSLSAAVLINEHSASAAELFTAVLRDYQLTTTVGKTTFGKGILQNIYSLAPYGYSGGVKLTTGYYNPPCGINYHDVGITPDVVAEQRPESAGKNPALLSDEEDDQLLAAAEVLSNKQ